MALFENLRSLFSPNIAYVYGGGMDMGVRVADMDAAQLYRTQPNLRAAVTFLADNAAQVPLKVHERAGDNDRPRVTDSAAALLLTHPNPDMTPFEFRRWMYSDLLLY
jgi:phage portal protein BeeE